MNRIKLKLGNFEVEYEGDQAFIQSGLLSLAREALEIAESLPSTEAASVVASIATHMSNMSTNTIAQSIDVKTGSDLALAAIAKINLVEKKGVASRQEILDEMREATTYFKESFASNLTSYLDTLVKSKKINQQSRGAFALAAAERGRLEQALQGRG